jgi:hypothetical protein
LLAGQLPRDTRFLSHTADHTAALQPLAANCSTASQPHTAARAHCRTLLSALNIRTLRLSRAYCAHTTMHPHCHTLLRALLHTATYTATHALWHTTAYYCGAHCALCAHISVRTAPHPAANCRAHCHTLHIMVRRFARSCKALVDRIYTVV